MLHVLEQLQDEGSPDGGSDNAAKFDALGRGAVDPDLRRPTCHGRRADDIADLRLGPLQTPEFFQEASAQPGKVRLGRVVLGHPAEGAHQRDGELDDLIR